MPCVLPDDVVPVNYDLTLEPDLHRCRFEGVVKVDVRVAVATDVVQLHSIELSYRNFHFESAAGQIAGRSVDVNLKSNIATFKFAEALPSTGGGAADDHVDGQIVIAFDGILNDQMAGFYRSEYQDFHGVKRYMATTQFEPIDARRAFPCVDEPAAKATFDVTLVFDVDKDANLMGISNMPEKYTEDFINALTGRRQRRVGFLRTPKMSTYLLAFVVSELEYIQDLTKDGTLVRCLAVPGRDARKMLSYALKCGVASLEFFNDFFQVPYPLPKVDMIAIPDFSMGAMENWGLVTFREIDLLGDEEKTAVTRKVRLATVVTHELSHQWFGNLVTMQWWNDLWLNEGFASWAMQYCFEQMKFPGAMEGAGEEFKLWERFTMSEQSTALKLDGLRSSHPIQCDLERAEDVGEIFDSISYAKGGSVVRQIFAVLGLEDFREGLRRYMNKFAYKNTVTQDLWACWEETSGKPVGRMMSTWTEQMGYPILTVSNADPPAEGKLIVKQEYFLGDGSSAAGDADKLWLVPVFLGYRGADGKMVQELHLVEEREAAIVPKDLKSFKTSPYFKLNAGQHVPMRVAYSATAMANLTKNLAELTPEDRIGLVQDGVAIYKTGNYGSADGSIFALLAGLKDEESVSVWEAIEQGVGFFAGAFEFIPIAEAGLKTLVTKLIAPRVAKLGVAAIAGESGLERQMRATIVGLAQSFAPELIASEARAMFAAFCESGGNDHDALPDDVCGTVLASCLKLDDGPTTMDALFSLLNTTSSQACRLSVYRAMGKAKRAEERARALALTIDMKAIRTQDYMYPYMGFTGREANAQAYQWLKSNFAAVHRRVISCVPVMLSHPLNFLTRGYEAARADDFAQFVAENAEKVTRNRRAIDQSLEMTRGNSRFVEAVKSTTVADKAFWKRF